jgi:hypothetical protein
MQTVRRALPHPIVFVFDFANDKVAVPEYDDQQVTSSNEACISVRVIADVDGEAAITLVDQGFEPPDTIKVFEGVVYAPTRRLSVVTSHNESLVETATNSDRPRVRIWVNDEEYPSEVWIAIG